MVTYHSISVKLIEYRGVRHVLEVCGNHVDARLRGPIRELDRVSTVGLYEHDK